MKTLLLLLGILVSELYLEGAENARTLAILSVDAGASANMVDQVAAKLSENGTIRLVEREALARVAKEREISSLGLTDRALLGQLLGADLLVLIRKHEVMGKTGLRVLVCDAPTGARLGQVDGTSVTADRLAEEIRGVIDRFPQGVQSAVVVPDVISRDLNFEYSGLQTGLADLLREALSREQGVAVVEFEEAKAISEENDLVGRQVRRTVPIFVDWEYRSDALAAGGPKVSIVAKLRMAQRPANTEESGLIPVNQAGGFVLGTLRKKLLNFLDGAPLQGFDSREEFTRLIGRANQFAEIGDFERSAAIREAALLLEPDSDEQRVRLVREYVRWNQQPVDVWPKGAKQTANDPYWSEVVARSRELWRRSLRHVDYLVRNARVNQHLGAELFHTSLHSISGIRVTAGNNLGEEEALKKDFIRHVAPALIALTDDGKNQTTLFDPPLCKTIENAFWRVDGNFLRSEDLELVGDLLCEVLPERTSVSHDLLYNLRDGTRLFSDADRNVSSEAWVRFVQRLLESERPLVHAYGRYAKLCDRTYRLKDVSQERLLEAQSLAASLRSPPLSTLDPQRAFYEAARSETIWAATALQSNSLPSRPWIPKAIAKAGTNPQPDGSILCERVRLKPFKPSIGPNESRRVQLLSRRWAMSDRCEEMRGLTPAWKGTDVLFTFRAVFFLNSQDKADLMLENEEHNLRRATFDGRYLWVSGTRGTGVYALNQDGRIAAHVTGVQGLPEADIEMPLLSLGQGKIMAAGCFGSSQRGWLATIEIVGSLPRVNVFHEAVKAWEYRDMPLQQVIDPAMSFRPEWIIEHVDEAKKRWIFVQRQRLPLMVDVDKLEVKVYPPPNNFDRGYFPRMDGGPSAFWSHKGMLYVAGSNNDFKIFRLDRQTHRFQSAEERPTKDWHQGFSAGCLAESQGYLYYVGDQRWLRRNLATGQEEILVKSPRSLPHYGAGGGWMIRETETHGLVAWYQERLYQVSIEPKTANEPAP